MTLQPLLETAASLLGPVDLVDDLTFSSKAQVARLRLPGGATVVAKRPVDSAAFTRELEALRVLPEAVRPALMAAGENLLIMEDLGPGPSLADCSSATIPRRPKPRCWPGPPRWARLSAPPCATARPGSPKS